MMSFVVVEFLHEEAVEVVHKSWIMEKDNSTYCYWPPGAGASAKVRREEMPDAEKWKLHEIRIFSFAETYAKALERAKKAENTSNVDTDQESLKRRATKRPAKFAFSEDEVADDEDDNYLEKSHTSLPVAVLPKPPHHHEVNAAPNSSICTKPSSSKSLVTQEGSSPGPQPSKYIVIEDGKRKCISASSPRAVDSSSQRPAVASEGELTDARFRTLMTHLKALDEKLQMVINFLHGRESKEDVEDVLPPPASSLEELADLCTKVADKTFKKKLTQYLSSLGGHNLGDTVRRILQKLGTNSVWSSYSMKGKKGKQAFTDTPLCSIVIKTCLTSYSKAKMSEVEDEIGEALKHAPKRKGGSKYKESERMGHQQRSVLDSSDSDD